MPATASLCRAHGQWRLKPPRCSPDCAALLPANLSSEHAASLPPPLRASGLLPAAAARACTECRCRACAACRCVDEFGRVLSPQVCERERTVRRDLDLGRRATAFACRRACDDYLALPPPPPVPPSRFSRAQLGAECTAWTYADGHCTGYTDLGLASSFQTPAGAAASSGSGDGLADPAAPVAEVREGQFDAGTAGCAAPRPSTLEPAASVPPPLRFAMVHTIASSAMARGVHANPGLMQRFRRAAAQFAATPHMYRVVQVSRACHDPRWWTTYCRWRPQGIRNEDASAGYWLRMAVGLKAVSLVNEKAVTRYFPRLLERSFAMRWSDTRLPFWMANLCDLPGLVWYRMHERRLERENISRVWVLQHDIGWTGQLPAILARFGDEHDLLCEGLGPVPDSWNHAREHNHPLRADQKWGCVLPVTRYSVALLAEQSRGLRRGNVSYCEMRAATACWNAPWPCRAADIRGRGLLGPFTFYTSVEETRLNESMRAPAAATPAATVPDDVVPAAERCHGPIATGAPASPVGRLFHRAFEPGLHRSHLADCPMICPVEWTGWREIAEAKQTGCVYNCGALKTPPNMSAPGN